METNYYREDFEVYLYKNNLWLKGKKNFFGEDYSRNFMRFTYAEDFTFNIFETEIREAAISSLPKITFSVELIQVNNPKIPRILKVNTSIGSEKENELHSTKMTYPEIIIHNSNEYTNLTKVEMPTEIYKKKYLENQFELIMINCRLYVISKYLKSKIYFGNRKLKYDLWTDGDEPECSLELCPKLNQKLDLDETHEDSDDDKDDDYNNIKDEISSLNSRVSSLTNNMIELQSTLDYLDKTICCVIFIIALMFLYMTYMTYITYLLGK